MGYPVPTPSEIVAKGVGTHPCTSKTPPCEAETNQMANALRQTRYFAGAMRMATFNEGEMELRKQFAEDWKAGVASKKVLEGEDAKKSVYMRLCKNKRLRGVNCDANYEALQNSVRKELGLPVVGILPGTTKSAGVPEQGTDLNNPKLLENTFYYPQTAVTAFGDPTSLESTSDMSALDKMSKDQDVVLGPGLDSLHNAILGDPGTTDRFLSIIAS
eukprot:jgi/Mesvir1/14607/Mv05277-RA.1